MVRELPFGAWNGAPVSLLSLSDGDRTVELLPLGAAVRAMWVPDRTGTLTDVVLGYDTAADYFTQDACFGGTIGRCANRIAGASVPLNGRMFRLTANEGANQLHGGVTGFHKKVWGYSYTEDTVTFTLDSPHGEEGYPGTLHAETAYTLRDGALTVSYRAVSDRDTVVNLTNHAYFNLAGHTGGVTADHVLTLRADRYTPCGPGNIPTGELAPVAGTALDLRAPTGLGERLGDPSLAESRGLDHNFVLNGGGAAAALWCPRTGIRLEVSTSLPGMQVYTAGFLTHRRGKDGAEYGPGHAVCLEPQFFPDAVHHPAFPSPILRAGEAYAQTITWRFDAE